MYKQTKWIVKEPKTEEAPAQQWLQPLTIRRNQIKTQGVSKLTKNLLNTTRGKDKKKKKGSLNQPEPEPEQESSFSLTHILSEASVVLSLAIKEELMALVNKQETTAKHKHRFR